MKNKKIKTFLCISFIIIFYIATIALLVSLMNDKTNMILKLQKENNQCNMQLDSIMQDYERLQNE